MNEISLLEGKMNILYISALPKTKSGGPRYSVPKQIEAQSCLDNVYWVNLNSNCIENSGIKCNEVVKKSFTVNSLPEPFNTPDFVVFQDVYNIFYAKIACSLSKRAIPYIIIPRGSLTKKAQKIKRIKKIIGNTLFFNKFIQNAEAIHFLTKNEKTSTKAKWTKKNFIIPNGIEIKHYEEKTQSNTIIGTFIGRMNMYHKGLDLLIKSIRNNKMSIIRSNIEVHLYGPNRKNAKSNIEKFIVKHSLQKIIYLHNEVFNHDKVKVLIESDFFIHTSRFEGLPMGLIEALSYGLPCLVTTGSNMADVIEENDAGWVADTNVKDISKALKYIIDNNTKIHKKRLNAHRLSLQYSWKNIARNTHLQYLRIIKSKTTL